MKITILHRTFSLFLLTLLLVSQVGLSFFHKHGDERKSDGNGLEVTTDTPDCPVCHLHLTHEYSIPGGFSFIFTLLVFAILLFFFHEKSNQVYLISSHSRGPPALI